jgi:hypothetical protein
MQNLDLYTGIVNSDGNHCLALITALKNQIKLGATELPLKETKKLKDAIYKANGIVDLESQTAEVEADK